MKLKNNILFFALGSLSIFACKDRSDEFSPFPLNASDTMWTQQVPCDAKANMLTDELQVTTYTDTFRIGQAKVFEFANGCRFNLPACTWRVISGAQTVDSGTGKITLRAHTKNGDFIRLNANAYQEASYFTEIIFSKDNVLLDSAINRTNNPFVLFLKSNSINSYALQSASSTSVYDPCTRKYPFGGNLTIPLQEAITAWDSAGVIKGYRISTPNFTSLHRIRLMTRGNGSTFDKRVNVILPLGFTNANTKTFMVYNQLKGCVVLEHDFVNKLFQTPRAVNRADIKIVTLTKRDNQYFLGSQNAIVDSLTNIIRITPQPTTLAAMNSFLDNL
jgi:hypothetical protein